MSRKRNTTIEEFIEIYESELCLWRVKEKDYHNKDKRGAAYDKLLKKLKELEPNSTKDDVVKKITLCEVMLGKKRKNVRNPGNPEHQKTTFIYLPYDTIICLTFLGIKTLFGPHDLI
nr:unnamed protein product [Callosobruchus analis]